MEHAQLHEFIVKNKDLINEINTYYKLGIPSLHYKIPFKYLVLAIVLSSIYYVYYYSTKKEFKIDINKSNCEIPKKNEKMCSTITDALDETYEDTLSDIEY